MHGAMARILADSEMAAEFGQMMRDRMEADAPFTMDGRVMRILDPRGDAYKAREERAEQIKREREFRDGTEARERASGTRAGTEWEAYLRNGGTHYRVMPNWRDNITDVQMGELLGIVNDQRQFYEALIDSLVNNDLGTHASPMPDYLAYRHLAPFNQMERDWNAFMERCVAPAPARNE